MRISWSAVDEIRINPRNWLERQAQSGSNHPRRYSLHRFLQHAILRYHTRGDDLSQAQAYVDERYWRNFKSATELSRIHDRLVDYAASFQRLQNQYVAGPVSVVLGLPPLLSHEFSVSGQIARLDMTSYGYAGWMFKKQGGNWVSELSMPLIQAAIAQHIGAELDEVRVGICDLSSGTHIDHSYTADEVSAASEEFETLLRQIMQLSSP